MSAVDRPAASAAIGELHVRLRERGITTLGGRLKIIAALNERTPECLEAHLAALEESATQIAPASESLHFNAAAVPREGTETTGRRRVIVVHSGCVFVRQQPRIAAAQLGRRFCGEDFLVSGVEQDGWLKLADDDGWILRDGCRAGVKGDLVIPLPPVGPDGLVPSTLPALYVMATDGLGNRLRVVLSFAAIAAERGRRLRVLWPVNNVCPGRFEDAFEPLPNVTFVDQHDDSLPRPRFPPPSHDFHPELKVRGEQAVSEAYRALRPTPAVHARVHAILEELGASFLSLHLRRTDHWGGPDTDEAFMDYVDAQPRQHVFLATDNAATQEKLVAYATRHGTRVFTAQTIVADQTRLRQTSLPDAAVDLFVAAHATGPFKGTKTSSFSDTILRLRRQQGKQHPADDHRVTDAEVQMAVTLHTPGGHKAHSPGMPMNSYGLKYKENSEQMKEEPERQRAGVGERGAGRLGEAQRAQELAQPELS